MGFGWHADSPGDRESLWGIRLDFEGGSRLVVALGQIGEEERAQYQPDSLVMMFDETELTRYKALAGVGDALGSPIPVGRVR